MTIWMIRAGLIACSLFCWTVAAPVATFAQKSAAAIPTPKGKFGNAVNIARTPLRVKSLKPYGQSPLTVEFWTKLPTDKKQRDHVLVSHLPEIQPGSWEFYTTPLDGLLSLRIRGEQSLRIPTFVRITDGRWHFIAFTWNGERVRVFVDGRQVAARKLTSPRQQREISPQASAGELFVGADVDGQPQRTAAALVDDLRISNVTREIREVPSAALDVDKATIALWNFDKPTGNTHADRSPLGNQLAYSPGIESAWTPRAALRADAPDWEKETDDDWHDDRFDKMDKGRVLGCAMTIPAALGNATPAVATKGLAISLGDKRQASVLFDRRNLQLMAAWTGGFVKIPSRRFGLIINPQPVGEVMFSQPAFPAWDRPDNVKTERGNPWEPLPRAWGRFLGYYRHGERTVLSYTVGGTVIHDAPALENVDGHQVIRRTIEVAPTKQTLKLNVLRGKQASVSGPFGLYLQENNIVTAAHLATPSACSLRCSPTDVQIHIPPHDDWLTFTVRYFRVTQGRLAAFKLREVLDKRSAALPEEKRHEQLVELTRGGPRNWPETLTTTAKIGRAHGQPFVVDDLTLPEKNPWGSVFYVTGLASLSADRLAICTIYGDVWIVSGLANSLNQLHWQRFASGLYQPMGLVLREGVLHVLERGQLTALHDLNSDGEADHYENFYNGWQSTGAGHAYDTGLQIAPDGSLFFFKGQTGAANCTESGCLLKVDADGRSHRVFATGFRHPIGLGISPAGVVTGADQQGNWMPATRIDRYRLGGFYGDMRTHHRKQPPKNYDPPLCWLPRDVDNSAGGQVWVPRDTWGPLANTPLHLSWGRCRLYALLVDNSAPVPQAGVVPLTAEVFTSGPITGKFHGDDGHLYVVGLHGWQTAGARDGCLHRIRRNSSVPLNRPVGLKMLADGVELTFSDPLDVESTRTIENWQVERWNYRYSAAYGSDHWSVTEPDRQGHDPVMLKAVDIDADKRTVRLRFIDHRQVMQLKVAWNIKTEAGEKCENVVHLTVNHIPANSARNEP